MMVLVCSFIDFTANDAIVVGIVTYNNDTLPFIMLAFYAGVIRYITLNSSNIVITRKMESPFYPSGDMLAINRVPSIWINFAHVNMLERYNCTIWLSIATIFHAI